MSSLQTAQENARIERNRKLGFAVRQAVIMILGALDDWLEIERTIMPRHKRDELRAKALRDANESPS
jgi:hypothetical protein